MGTAVRAETKVQVWAACLLLPFLSTATDPGIPQPEVDTTLGRIRGQQVGVKDTARRVNVFLGIPFAQAPVGPGRFSAPHPAPSWEGVRDASTAPPMCLQEVERMDNFRFLLNGKHRVFSVSEDCLILNIYSPAEATAGAGRPVMVWIHGGSMMVGAATSHDGSALAAFGDVVVVTIQYRLGILGFLSTGDRHAPGNWGLLDTVAALRWVQENISPFGGNPNSVTIFGESVGGAIVSALVLSPLSAGLFHRAIAQSGIITAPGLLGSDPLSLAQDFADSLACSSDSTAEMLQCLRQKTGEEMILTKESRQKISIMPYTIDGTFFPKNPGELLRERQFHPVPLLLGVTSHEISWLIPKGWGVLDRIQQMSQEDIQTLLGPIMTALGIPQELWVTVIDEYVGNALDPLAIRDAFLDFMSDMYFNFPAVNFSRNFRDAGGPVFFYEFQHRPSCFAKIKPDWVRADHGAEMAFMFGGPFLTDESSLLAFPEATEEEKQLSLTMMAQWTNFARTGNPNGEGLPYWPLFNQSEKYLEVSLTPRVGQKLKEARMQIWAEILPAKIQQWQQKQKGRKAKEEL